MGDRREAREEADVYIVVTDLCCCMVETNTTVTKKRNMKRNVYIYVYTQLNHFYVYQKLT